MFSDFFNVPFLPNKDADFTFVDLFAGIGGFRLAMQAVGGKCIFSSEFNEPAQKTYFANYGDMPFGDITLEETKRYIPDYFDVLCAGFPCQAFSIKVLLIHGEQCFLRYRKSCRNISQKLFLWRM